MQTNWWNNNEVNISFQPVIPRTAGSKAFEKYEKYKAAGTVGEAKSLGAITTDLKFDYDKGSLHLLGGSYREHIEEQEGEDGTRTAEGIVEEEVKEKEQEEGGEETRNAGENIAGETSNTRASKAKEVGHRIPDRSAQFKPRTTRDQTRTRMEEGVYSEPLCTLHHRRVGSQIPPDPDVP